MPLETGSLVGVLVAVAVVALLVVGVVRFASGAEARARRAAEHGESAGSGMFGELVEIFQPSRTHVTTEKERVRLDVVQRPAEGLPFGVDLDSGVAYLPGRDGATEAGPEGVPTPGGRPSGEGPVAPDR